MSSDDRRPFNTTQQILLRVAEQIGVCSREIAHLAQQVEGLRQRLQTLEQACTRSAPDDREHADPA